MRDILKLTRLLVSLLILMACSNAKSIPPAVPEEPLGSVEIEPTLAPSADPKTIAEAGLVEAQNVDTLDLTQLWSYGLTSIRTGELLIEEGGEHKLDKSIISYGHNLVVDKNGKILTPRGRPLQGGEQLILTEAYQDDYNTREYARIYTIMAPIRDTFLYHFEETSREKWLAITEVLTMNNIKTKDAAEITRRSILSTKQVYDYVAGGEAEGSPVMRYLEEAGLELKCLAFKDFDFTNPEGRNYCKEHNIEIGSGIELP